MDMDFDSQFGDDRYHDGSGMGKFVTGGCVLLGVLALGGLIGKLTSSSAPAQPAQTVPAVSVQQQMMLDVRRQMAEAEQGYYEDRRVVDFGGYEQYDEYADGN